MTIVYRIHLNRKLHQENKINKNLLNVSFLPVWIALVFHSENGENVPKIQDNQGQANDRSNFLHAKVLKESKSFIQ